MIKLNTEKELIYKALELFSIKDIVVDYSTYISYSNFERQPSEVKIIARVNFPDRNSLIVKVTKEDHINNLLAEKQSNFADRLRLNDINTPLKYNLNGKYVLEWDYHGHTLNFSVEIYIGSHIEKLSTDSIYEIGKLLGKMHKISVEDSLKLNTIGYVFNFLGKNEVVRFDKLKDLCHSYPVQEDLIDKIEEKYNLSIAKVTDLLSFVAKYAVQGDINASNLSKTDKRIWVFDYNIACDEYLVIDFVIGGLMLSYEEQYDDNSTQEDRFESFAKGYLEERKLLKNEELAFPIIFKVARALWFTKIHINNDSIEELLKKSEFSKVNTILKDILHQLG